MQKTHYLSGQTLLEALLALGLLSVAISGSLLLAFRYLNTSNRVRDLVNIGTVMEEGFEAIESIAYRSWGTLVTGATNYGLVQSGGVWNVTTTPDIIQGRYTRTVHIAAVYRDTNCNIVAGGGTLDPDTKKITIDVAGSMTPIPFQRSSTKYITNWKNATPLCTTTQAGSLFIDVENAELDSTKKEMHDVEFTNTGFVSITIDKMIVSWVKPDGSSPSTVQSIKIDNEDRWHSSNGTGSPQGNQPSGTVLDFPVDLNVVIAPGETVDLDRIRFNAKLDAAGGTKFTITAIMADASQTSVTTPQFLAYVHPFSPTLARGF